MHPTQKVNWFDVDVNWFYDKFTITYPAVATNWNVKLSVVSFNSKRHYPLMFSLFSFARCVFWSVGHTMAEYWGNWSPGSAKMGAISGRGDIDARLDLQRWRLLSMWHHASILMVCQILVPTAPIKRKAPIKSGIASKQQLFQRFFTTRGARRRWQNRVIRVFCRKRILTRSKAKCQPPFPEMKAEFTNSLFYFPE